jgi:hypothetical protein
MRFLEINEIWEWCARLGIELDRQVRPALDPSLSQAARWLYADSERSGREPGLARVSVQKLGAWDESLLWITQVGVWPSSEDWPVYYAMRGRYGERRSIDVAPGHLFRTDEAGQLVEFLTAAMENGWDASVLSAHDGRVVPTRVQVSHDEWIELQSTIPVSFDVDAV